MLAAATCMYTANNISTKGFMESYHLPVFSLRLFMLLLRVVAIFI